MNRSDDFNRADDVVLGTPSDGGSAWIVDIGSFAIDSHQGAVTAFGPSGETPVASLETGSNVGSVSVRFPVVGTTTFYVIVRLLDGLNFVGYEISPAVNFAALVEVGGGGQVSTGVTITVANSDIYTITVDRNNLVSFYQNGVFMESGTSTFVASATRRGISTRSFVKRFDDFSTRDLQTTILAIRYDWPYATSGSNSGNNTFDQEQVTLSPSAFHGQLPFLYGQATGTNTVVLNAGDQAMMAFRCGIDGYLFDFYANAAGYPLNGSGAIWTGVNDGLKKYLSSTKKPLVKFAVALIGPIAGTMALPITTGNWGPIADQLVTLMGDSQYMLGPSSRPMLYLFDAAGMASNGLTSTMITTLRTKASNASLADPLILAMPPVATDDSATIASLGLNGLSHYTVAPPAGTGVAVSVATYDVQHTTAWDLLDGNSGGYSVVPCVALGWDIRARESNNFWCSTLGEGCGTDDYTIRSMPAQVVTRMQQGISYINAHQTHFNFGQMLTYAWNENSESGNGFAPAPNDKGINLQLLAQKLGRQRESRSTLRGRGIQFLSR